MWFVVDDQFTLKPKVEPLLARLMTGDALGLAAIGLWTAAGSRCQAKLSDGVVTQEDLARLTLNLPAAVELANILVDAGLWHPYGHTCEACAGGNYRQLAPGQYQFHDWFAMRYRPGHVEAINRAKKEELNSSELRRAIWLRDCDDPTQPLKVATVPCAYCGQTLSNATRRGDRAPELDHVDPTKAIGAANIVIACRACNAKKGNRTLQEQGMRLRPLPPRADGTPRGLGVTLQNNQTTDAPQKSQPPQMLFARAVLPSVAQPLASEPSQPYATERPSTVWPETMSEVCVPTASAATPNTVEWEYWEHVAAMEAETAAEAVECVPSGEPGQLDLEAVEYGQTVGSKSTDLDNFGSSVAASFPCDSADSVTQTAPCMSVQNRVILTGKQSDPNSGGVYGRTRTAGQGRVGIGKGRAGQGMPPRGRVPAHSRGPGVGGSMHAASSGSDGAGAMAWNECRGSRE